MKLADLSRCDHLGVCAMNAHCPHHTECAAQAQAGADRPPLTADGMFSLCEITLLGLAFVIGMFCGGLLVGTFNEELRALCWAALHVVA